MFLVRKFLALIYSFSLTALLIVPAMQIRAQDTHQTWAFGIGYGAMLGINESKNNAVVFEDRIEAIAFNGLTPGVSPELGLSFFTLHSKDTGTSTSYKTNMIAPDLRVRISYLASTKWFPYLNLGFGVALYDVVDKPSAAAPNAFLSDATLFLPLGLGLFHQFSDHLGIDVNVNLCPSLSDDINPVHDGRPDAWWSSSVSLLIVL